MNFIIISGIVYNKITEVMEAKGRKPVHIVRDSFPPGPFLKKKGGMKAKIIKGFRLPTV